MDVEGTTRSHRQELGAWGEELVTVWLRERGWRVVDRNWRCRRGEIDLVLRDPDGVLVFVEVKTRRSDRYGHPAEVLDPRKLTRLRVLAWSWVHAHPGVLRPGPGRCFRIDLVGVLAGASGEPEVHHLEAVA